MDRTKYIKTIIGYLIGFYRKEYNKASKSFVISKDEYYKDYCNECKKCNDIYQICSQATLYRLEKGHIVNNDCIYERLAHQLGKKAVLDNYSIYERLDLFYNELYGSLVDFSKTRLEKIEANLQLELIKYKNVLYVEEILSIYLNIVQYELYGTDINDKHGKVYLFLRGKLNDNNEKMITYLFYLNWFRILNMDFTIENINEQCSKYYDDPIFYEPKLYSITSNNFFVSYNNLINNELINMDKMKIYQRYQLYCQLGCSEFNLEAYDKCYDTFRKCILYLEQFDPTNRIIAGNHIYLGRVCYMLKKYEESAEWFSKAREIKESKSIGHDYLFLFSSLEKIGDSNEIHKLIKDIDMSKMKNKYGKKIVTYYRMKHNFNLNDTRNLVELENYICDLKPILDLYGPFHKNVFEEDLKDFVSRTGNYKKYHSFNSISDNILSK